MNFMGAIQETLGAKHTRQKVDSCQLLAAETEKAWRMPYRELHSKYKYMRT